MSNFVKSLPVATDDHARHELCHRFAEAMRAGAFRFQVRFTRHGEVPGDVWIYVYQSHEWLKLSDYVFPAELVPSLWNQMEMVSTRKYTDSWVCLRSEHADRTDFKLMFRRKFIKSHIEGNLESVLIGCLFLGHHDSGKDSRRRIRFRGK